MATETETPGRGPQRYAVYFYNRVTYVGIALTVVFLVVEGVLLAVDYWMGFDSPYFGLILYLILPPVLVAGVALILGGAWWTRRRLRRDPNAVIHRYWRIDFSNPAHRRTATVLLIGGAGFLALSSVGMYHTYHYTESVSFCGEVCHKVMDPEFTVYQTSAHANVKCASCHIGPGAGYFAKSKLSGAYQIYAVLAEKYPKPIPTPVKNLRPAQETCEQCHWPQQFYSPKERTFSHFLSDEKNTPSPIRLMVNVGGGRVGKSQTGIHAHMNINHLIEYVARDEAREDIAWVRSTDRVTGAVQEYRSKSAPPADTELAPSRIRRMDCIDCHNRPSHKFPSAQDAVNEALDAGTLDRAMPYIKREAVKVLDREYATRADAMAGIAAQLGEFYDREYPDLARSGDRVTGVILAVQDLHQKTQFPEMRSSWKAYPDHIGHLNSAGCFRCHNGDLANAKDRPITKDCKTCHTFLQPEGVNGWTTRSYVEMTEFVHPGDVGDLWKENACHDCHKGGSELY